MIEEDTSAFDAGVAQANNPEDPGAAVREAELCKYWLGEIDRVRQFDEAAYAQAAKDRAYAAGKSSFVSKTPVISSYIDTWHALLYARDPDIDVMPKKVLEKEPIIPPELVMQQQAAAMLGLPPPPLPEDPAIKLQQDAIEYSKTMALVLQEQWRIAKFKQQADPFTRAALTVPVGWLKVTWQSGDAAQDALSGRPLQDLRDNLARIEAELLEADAMSCGNLELQKAQLELTIKSIEAQVEQPVQRGTCVDAVDMADITVSDAVPSVTRYTEAPWISHRIYMPLKDGVAALPGVPYDKLKQAATFSPKKPIKEGEEKSGALMEFVATDADSFRSHAEGGKYICIEEVWNRKEGQILTFVRGLDCMGRKPFAPPVTSRFYGFFQLTFCDVDGTRWPQSLTQRAAPIQDEYDRANEGLRIHRQRSKPGMIFNNSAVDPKSVEKIKDGETGEYIGIDLVSQKDDIRRVFSEKKYPAVDIALYSTDPMMQRFELVYGLQEAMTASLDTAKTATEAEIQQSGTMARTGSKRDKQEAVLTDIAQYIAQLCMDPETGLTYDEVRQIAGPNALWLEGLDIASIQRLISIEIRAGSSGKPNTKAMRETWAEILPMAVQAIEKIGLLRGSSPQDMADCYEELLKETFDRSGERVDITRFIPLPGQPGLMGGPLSPGLPGPAGPGPSQGEPPPEDGAPPPDPNHPVPRN